MDDRIRGLADTDTLSKVLLVSLMQKPRATYTLHSCPACTWPCRVYLVLHVRRTPLPVTGVRARPVCRPSTVSVAVDARLLMAGSSTMEGAMSHAAQKALGTIGSILYDAHRRIARELGTDSSYTLRIPFSANLGGWQFEGVWVCDPILGQRVWKLEGVLELQGHEPRRFRLWGQSGRPFQDPGKGPGG